MFSVYENDSELLITIDVSRPPQTEFSIIIVASPDTADGTQIRLIYLLTCNINLSITRT